MARFPDHYRILGLPRDASSVDIAHAFREKLEEARSRQGPDAELHAEGLRVAYQVLANPASRAEYDAQLLPDPKQKRAAAAAEGGGRRWMLVVPIVVVAVAVGIYKFRTPTSAARAPSATVVSRTVLEDSRVRPEDVQLLSAKTGPSGRTMSAEEVFAAVSGSVARIQVADGSGAQGQGSGVVTGPGVVVTNCHVVNNASQITVKVGGQVYDASVRIADRDLDLCSLSVAGLGAPSVSMPTFEAKVGQRVFAIGAPQGLDLTLSEGLVSSLRETSRGSIIQTTAAVSPGSSGGGLFNTSGQLVGIVTFQYRSGQNLNFALPAAWLADMTTRDSSDGLADRLR
jgi:S1-C subfamily serine protease